MRNKKNGFLAILLLIVVFGIVPRVKADPPSAPAIWLEPATLNFDTNNTRVGDQFDVTVWVSSVGDVFTYQVKVTYDPTMLNVSCVNYTAIHGSEWLTGHTTVAVAPAIDNVHGFVVVGETLLRPDVANAGIGSICDITFVIIAAPGPGASFASLIDTNHPLSSYILDPSVNKVAGVLLGRATYTLSAGGAPPTIKHQVVVSGIIPSSNHVLQGDSLPILVETMNNGTVVEAFDVNVTYGDTLIGKQTVDSLAVRNMQTLTFYWNTAGVKAGNYTITATATPVEGQTDLDDVSKWATVEVTEGMPQSGPSHTTVFTDPPMVQSTFIGQNFTVNMNVSDVSDLFTWQMRLTFDVNILECTGCYEGEFLKKSGDKTIFVQSGTSQNLCGASLVGQGSGVSGSGQLAYATFTSIGLGVSDIHLTDIFLLGGGLERIPVETVESFTVPTNGTNYEVKIVDNLTGILNASSPVSGVFNTTFNVNEKAIAFVALAMNNWYCQISVPKELLSCNNTSEWAVKVDGAPVTYDATENATFTTLYFTQYVGNHSVQIIGTNVMGANTQNQPSGGNTESPSNSQSPSPPPLLVMVVASLCLMTLMAALVDLRRTRSYKMMPNEFVNTPSESPSLQ